MKVMKAYKDTDSYIKNFPKDVQEILHLMRATIKKAAPHAEEAIKYGIPTFVQEGNLVHFGGYARHIGFYPGATAVEMFKKELVKYETSKGTVKFPLGTPLPKTLIEKIVRYRVRENVAKRKEKK